MIRRGHCVLAAPRSENDHWPRFLVEAAVVVEVFTYTDHDFTDGMLDSEMLGTSPGFLNRSDVSSACTGDGVDQLRLGAGVETGLRGAMVAHGVKIL